jgi:multidrug resistance efflux pump
MIELILGTYGVLCWLVFKKFRLVPMTTYTVCTAILIGFFILAGIFISLSICHPVSHDCRLYAPVVQITPQVRGVVIEVPIETNTLLKEGDILFRIDPRPYELEVERLEAVLASKNALMAQLSSRLDAAEAQVRLERSNLLISESEDDRQARVALEQAKFQVAQTTSQLEHAKSRLDRADQLRARDAMSDADYEATLVRVQSLEADLLIAQESVTSAEERLKSGSDRMQAAREQLSVAEATAADARIALEAEIDGVNPEVKQIMAELENKRWELEQTVVRAPTDGVVIQLALRPGQMAVPLPFTAPVLFVPSERPYLVASFPQNVIKGFEHGLEAELAFKAFPGRIYRCTVERLAPIIPEGAVTASNQLRAVTLETAKGRIPVTFHYDAEIENLDLPIGAQASVAVYTHQVHALSIIRKIILRIKSWENYVLVPMGLGH